MIASAGVGDMINEYSKKNTKVACRPSPDATTSKAIGAPSEFEIMIFPTVIALPTFCVCFVEQVRISAKFLLNLSAL